MARVLLGVLIVVLGGLVAMPPRNMPWGTLTTFHPESFHGDGLQERYFEGWYYKMTSSNEDTTLAVIPGIFLGNTSASSESCAFIMVLDGLTGREHWFQFSIDDFNHVPNALDVTIGSNRFTSSFLELDLSNDEVKIMGKVSFAKKHGWPVTFLNPGVMGYLEWLPFLECYHAILSMTHWLDGTVEINERHVAFTGGRGYLEKDRGRTFPQEWVWGQSNHFGAEDEPVDASVSVSIARIPIIPFDGLWFRGFLIGFHLDGQLHQFTSYFGSSITMCDDENGVQVTASNLLGTRYLEVNFTRSETVLLHGPRHGAMVPFVPESVTASVHVRYTEGSHVLFEGSGRHVGLEITSGAHVLSDC